MKNIIEFSRIHINSVLPARNNKTDAGIDLYCHGNYIILPMATKIVKTGVRVKIPKGYFGLLKPKSKNTHLVGAGVIDEGYQGELLVKVVNITNDLSLVLTHGVAVAQLLLIPTNYFIVSEIEDKKIFKKETDRGDSGGIVTQLRWELGYDE
jgi:dUTP pyrophosphatase